MVYFSTRINRVFRVQQLGGPSLSRHVQLHHPRRRHARYQKVRRLLRQDGSVHGDRLETDKVFGSVSLRVPFVSRVAQTPTFRRVCVQKGLSGQQRQQPTFVDVPTHCPKILRDTIGSGWIEGKLNGQGHSSMGALP